MNNAHRSCFGQALNIFGQFPTWEGISLAGIEIFIRQKWNDSYEMKVRRLNVVLSRRVCSSNFLQTCIDGEMKWLGKHLKSEYRVSPPHCFAYTNFVIRLSVVEIASYFIEFILHICPGSICTTTHLHLQTQTSPD